MIFQSVSSPLSIRTTDALFQIDWNSTNLWNTDNPYLAMPNDFLKELVLGTVQFGLNYGISNPSGQTPRSEVSKILEYAWANGLSSLDTAYSYGNSEAILGESIEKEFKIITKIQYNEDIAICKKNFQESLEHLKRDTVYGLLSHEADAIVKQPKIWDLLQLFKSTGIAEKIGYSLYFPKELEKLLSLGFFPDLIQVPLNLLDKRFEPYFKELKSGGCEIHARSAFLQGLFFLHPSQLSVFFNEMKPLIENLRLSLPTDEELSAFLIRTCLHTGIDKVVVGINNLSQLQNIAKGLALPATKIDINIKYSNISEKIILPIHWPK